jgi:cyclin-dependent kinase 10
LLGSTEYDVAIDVWSVGCVMGELLLGKPLCPGEDEITQIKLIIELLGCPNGRIWPGVNTLPLVAKGRIDLVREQERNPYNNIRALFPKISDQGFDLFNRLLAYDPQKRISARKVRLLCLVWL